MMFVVYSSENLGKVTANRLSAANGREDLRGVLHKSLLSCIRNACGAEYAYCSLFLSGAITQNENGGEVTLILVNDE